MAGILYVWLPCKKIYPVGATYLADFIHRERPEVEQRILDLSILPRPRRRTALREAIRDLRPDLIAFSWRDIQVFAPHEGDPSLKYAFNFYYSPNPWKRLAASWKGLQFLYTYYRQIQECLSYPWIARREAPGARLMIGGGAFSVFADPLMPRLPEGTIGILGEGETVVLKALDGADLSDERYLVRRGGQVIQGTKGPYLPVDRFTIDLPYLEKIFPQHAAYHDEVIGVQTKRGCPYDCQFCEYPYIEGKKVRYRPAANVVADLLNHYHHWGSRRFWFTDAQFITGGEAYPQCHEILERILASGMEIEWSGYVRTSLITPELARLMVRSGVGDLEVAITSGSQQVLNELHVGFLLEKVYDGCRYLKEAGFAGRLILNYSLNSPGDSEEGLRQSVASYRRIAGILGEDRVFPMLFFLGVQPHTGFERRLIEEGYLYAGYNPLSLNPLSIKKMLYNPPPLSKIIARACLRGWEKTAREHATRSGTTVAAQYADSNLFRGVAENSGREVLIHLEQELTARTDS